MREPPSCQSGLTQADVGMAMGTGTYVAMESGEVTLVKESLTGIATSIELSKATIRNVHQNLVGAFAYNTLGIPVLAGVLYPFFEILLSPLLAGAAMAFSSVTVVSNDNRMSVVILDLVGLALIGLIVWYFWLSKPQGSLAAVGAGGVQEAFVVVKGGYSPDTVGVETGKPVELVFKVLGAVRPTAATLESPASRRGSGADMHRRLPCRFLARRPGRTDHQWSRRPTSSVVEPLNVAGPI